MEGKMIKFSEVEDCMWTKKLDGRDMEILQDVLEAHLEWLQDALRDCVVDDESRIQYEDDIERISSMLDLIYMEVEDETD